MGDVVGGLFMALIALAAMVVTIIAALWAMVDAEDRGLRGWPAALLVLFLHIPGLLIWLLFRPRKRVSPRTLAAPVDREASRFQ